MLMETNWPDEVEDQEREKELDDLKYQLDILEGMRKEAKEIARIKRRIAELENC